jgi:hypothetical protein
MVFVPRFGTEQPAMYDAAKPQLVGSVAIDLRPANFRPTIWRAASIQPRTTLPRPDISAPGEVMYPAAKAPQVLVRALAKLLKRQGPKRLVEDLVPAL